MIPFLTVRGGPLIGQEALSLQGIPIDLLLLTRETEDNLADLAGNAMCARFPLYSTTNHPNMILQVFHRRRFRHPRRAPRRRPHL